MFYYCCCCWWCSFAFFWSFLLVFLSHSFSYQSKSSKLYHLQCWMNICISNIILFFLRFILFYLIFVIYVWVGNLMSSILKKILINFFCDWIWIDVDTWFDTTNKASMQFLSSFDFKTFWMQILRLTVPVNQQNIQKLQISKCK